MKITLNVDDQHSIELECNEFEKVLGQIKNSPARVTFFNALVDHPCEKIRNKIQHNRSFEERSDDFSIDWSQKSDKWQHRATTLIPYLTFGNFLRTKSNKHAVSAASLIAKSSEATYNPLFIQAGVGLGKSHLLNAIGNQFRSDNPEANICYLHATEFVSDVVRAFKTKQFNQFKKYYSSLDLMLIDDIQFIADKPGTQQELNYILDSLIDANKQVVISCNSTPQKLSGIESRLVSRFSGGLTVGIESPSVEERTFIIIRKIEDLNLSLKNNVAIYIAEHVGPDIREIEGVANSIAAHARFNSCPISLKLVKKVIRG